MLLACLTGGRAQVKPTLESWFCSSLSVHLGTWMSFPIMEKSTVPPSYGWLGSYSKENAQKNAWNLNTVIPWVSPSGPNPKVSLISGLPTQKELKHDSQVLSAFQQAWDLDSAFYYVAAEKFYKHSELLHSLVCKIGLITCLPECLLLQISSKSQFLLFCHWLFQGAEPLGSNGAGEWHRTSKLSFSFIFRIPSPHPPLYS